MGSFRGARGALLVATLALGLSGCITYAPTQGPVATHTTNVAAPRPAESASFEHESDKTRQQVCGRLSTALGNYNRTVDPSQFQGETLVEQPPVEEPTVDVFIEALSDLSTDVSDIARDSEPGTDTRTALRALASGTASAADTLTVAGALTNTQELEYRTAFADAIDVCELDIDVE